MALSQSVLKAFVRTFSATVCVNGEVRKKATDWLVAKFWIVSWTRNYLLSPPLSVISAHLLGVVGRTFTFQGHIEQN